MRLKTWNMQGAKHRDEVKWQNGVDNMFVRSPPNPDAICLQEAGTVPDGAKHRENQQFPVPGGGVTSIQIYDWAGTWTRPARTIIFHFWDVNGHRVNTGVVTKEPVNHPANVHLAWPAAAPMSRPAVGVQIGLEWIFSFHAIAGGGFDAPGMLAAIAAFAGPAIWRVGADFNRHPGTLAGLIPANGVVCPPNDNTHPTQPPSVSQLDYSVSRGAVPQTGEVDKSMPWSDHWPVGFAWW